MNKKFTILIVIAIALRLLLAGTAHHGDLNNNISWGQELWSRGIVDYYGSPDANMWPYSAPNQPPLYILLFGANEKIAEFSNTSVYFLNENIGIFPSKFVWWWEEKGATVIYKLFPIIADVLISYVIFVYFRQKKKHKLGIIAASIWLVNPVSWYNSAIWGQTDPIVNLLGLISITFLLKKKLVSFSGWFIISVLFKGSLLIFAPVLFLVAIMQKHSLGNWVKSVFLTLTIIILSSIWFHPQIDFPIWFINLYINRILPGEIGYLSANAFNFWWLVDSGKTNDSIIYYGISARLWGILIAAFGVICIYYWLIKSKVRENKILISLAIMSVIVFLFMTRIHERYLYPFFPLATMLLPLNPSLIVVYIIYSLTFTLNMYHLFWAPSVPFLEELFKNYSVLASIISVINIVTFIWFLRHLKTRKV